MKVFLDIGGHEGQTLLSVLDPKYAFDKIYVFEPVKSLHEKLDIQAAGRQNVTLLQFGLWNKNAQQKIYSPGTLAGSIFSGHTDIDEAKFELCEFVTASEWFAQNIYSDDEVYAKLNCEGAEADILLDLLQSKEIFKIKNVAIDFDVRKVKGLENAQEQVLNSFEKQNFTAYSLCEDAMRGPTHLVRVQSWLDAVGARKPGFGNRLAQSVYWLRTAVSGKRPGYSWELKHAIKSLTPLILLKLTGARRS